MHRLADFVVGRRALTAGLLVVVSLVAAVGVMRVDYDSSTEEMLRAEGEDSRRLDEVHEQFGSDDLECVVVLRADDLFTPGSVEALRRLVDRLRAIDGIAAVSSLHDIRVFHAGLPRMPLPLLPYREGTDERYERAREEAAEHPLVIGQLLSEDLQSTLVTARLDDEVKDLNRVRRIVGQVQTAAHAVARTSNMSAEVTGIPVLQAEIYNTLQDENAKFTIIGVLLTVGVAWLLFGRLSAVTIVSLGPLVGTLWTLGLMGLVGEKVNILNVVLPSLVIVLGFTNSVHLMIDIRKSREAGIAPRESARLALLHVGRACLISAVTTAIGFASLVVADADIVRRFGIACAGGAMLGLFAVLTVVPLLASTRLADHAFAPRDRGVRRRLFGSFSGRGLVDWVLRNPTGLTAGGVALTALLATSVFFLVPDSALTESVPSGRESYRGLGHIDRRFGGLLDGYVVVDWPAERPLADEEVLGALDDVHELIGETPQIAHPRSVLSLLESLSGEEEELADRVSRLERVPEREVRRLVRPDLDRALVTFKIKDLGSSAYRPVFREMRERLETLESRHPGFGFHLTGTIVVAADHVDEMILDLGKSLALASAVIFACISLVYGSLAWGAICILPNAFPLAATSALIVLTGQPLQLTSVMVFSICLGIAVDDTIHFLNRFSHELHRGRSPRHALRRTYAAVGSALVLTTVVLLSGFGSPLLSAIPATRWFAMLSCIAIGAALIGDLVLLPAMLLKLGGRAARQEPPRELFEAPPIEELPTAEPRVEEPVS